MFLITQLRICAIIALTLFLVFSLSTTHLAFASEALVQLSSDPFQNTDSQHKTQVEPDTFAFGNTVVSTFQSGRFFDGGASDIGWATSTNGGETWSHGFLPATTINASPKGPYARVSDPSVAYDAHHGAWMVSYLGIASATNGSVDVLVSRSTNGGLTWGNPVIVNKSGDFFDKNWTVCDDTASSPFYGHCYTEFDDASKLNLVQVSTSTDGGKTWGAALTTPDQACVLGGQPLVKPNGTVIVPIGDCFLTAILSLRYTDGGKSWGRVVLAAQILATVDPGGIRSGPLPTAEIDRAGRVYVVWSDCRFEPNCATNDLVIISSTDGVHWTLPRRIPIDPVGSNVDHFIPGLAVDRRTADGSAHLGLAYYYFPNVNCTTSTCQLDLGFISSTNGGANWSKAEQLAGPMTLTWLPNTTLGYMVGDYISTSIVPGDDDATPVFEVASPPTNGASCGLPPVVCHEATYTTSEDLMRVVGGTIATDAHQLTFAAPARPIVRHRAY